MTKYDMFKELLSKKLSSQYDNVKVYENDSIEKTWTTYDNKPYGEAIEGTYLVMENEDFVLNFVEITDNAISLTYINVYNQGQGLGTELMNTLLDVADEVEVGITTFASPFEAKYANIPAEKLTRSMIRHMTKATNKLIEWYESFDFSKYVPGRPYKLIYLPPTKLGEAK